MDISEYSKRCLADQPPPCADACPLGLDILDLIGKLKSGLIGAAAKLYRSQAVFPGLVSALCPEPCREACDRRDSGGSIRLKNLESFLWRELSSRPVPAYFVPPQNKRIVIVGAGPVGLAAAVKLAGRGFAVELSDRRDRPGGRLLLSAEPWPAAALENELRAVSKFLELRLNTEITALAGREFDAALITVPGLAHLTGPGVLVAPEPADGEGPAGLMRSLRLGVEWSYRLESQAKVGRVEEPPGRPRFRPFRRESSIASAASSSLPDDPGQITADAARAEAARCLVCSCRNCLEACDVLRATAAEPKRVFLNVAGTVNKLTFTKKAALRPILACRQCGGCDSVCPAGLNFRQMYQEARAQLRRDGQLPTAAHDFWLADQAMASGPDAAFYEGPQQPEWLFFPGCQLGASDPAYVHQAYGWLDSVFPGRTALLTGCCGAPSLWAGDRAGFETALDEIQSRWKAAGRPRLVLSCPTCRELVRRERPEMESVSLWSLMERHFNRRGTADQSQPLAVFDPCASRFDPEAQNAIRSILAGLGRKFQERSADAADCCGYGGLAGAAGPKMAAGLAALIGPAPDGMAYLTYCANCRDRLAAAGHGALHLLDVLFVPDPLRARRPPPHLSQRRVNRRQLKLDRVGSAGEGAPGPAAPAIRLDIPSELAARLDAAIIPAEDLEAAIAQAEAPGGAWIGHPDGSRTAHLALGPLTYWARYRVTEDGRYALLAAWRHKMRVREGAEHGGR